MRRPPPSLLLGLVNGALVLAIALALAGGAAVAAHPLAAAAAVALAIAIGVFTGYRWMAPARRLAGAAARLGAGDLRTPLPAEGDAEMARLGGTLERSTLRLLGLVENLLASARLETGDWAMRSEPVDLADVAREAAVLLAPLFEQRRQRVEAAFGDSGWAIAGAWVVGDRTQLLQVMLNLLGNANKFSPESTRVRIAGGRDGAEAVLRVEDEGPGLPPGDEASLFGRYRRFGGTARPAGAGLGLWIVHAIVKRHGGSVTAETRAEGGARFTVRLPAASAPVSASAPRGVGDVLDVSVPAGSAAGISKVGIA